MDYSKHRIIILGAGLSGLTLAYLLKKNGVNALVLEARNRIGGRISTIYKDKSSPIELGATWLGKKHVHLVALIQELDLSIFPQILGNKAIFEPISTSPPSLVTLPKNEEPSYRIDGGTLSLVNSLYSLLEPNQVLLKEEVSAIIFEDKETSVITNKGTYKTDIIVSTLPPNLLVNTIKTSPAIPNNVREIASKTHTWMGESIKVCLTYPTPFWRKVSSGTIFSNVGPISEMYDHSNEQDSFFALKGFMNGGFYELPQENRKEYVLRQLSKYYINKSLDYTDYFDCTWRTEKYTYTDYKSNVLPHQNNGHAIFKKPLFNQKFIISGSETASTFPGYMDGAVESANYVYNQIKNFVKNDFI